MLSFHLSIAYIRMAVMLLEHCVDRGVATRPMTIVLSLGGNSLLCT
jgi:hypothetical protein